MMENIKRIYNPTTNEHYDISCPLKITGEPCNVCPRFADDCDGEEDNIKEQTSEDD